MSSMHCMCPSSKKQFLLVMLHVLDFSEGMAAPHAIHFVLAAEHAVRLPRMIEAGMCATLRDCTLPHHASLAAALS